MKRLEIIGNYFVVTETASEEVIFEAAKKNIEATYKNGKLKIINPDNSTYHLKYGETVATGSVELTGGIAGSVDGITVNAIEIMSGAEAFDTDLATTASNVADNINANTSTPNYTAVAVGALITITATIPGAIENGNAVVSSVTTITTTDVNMSGATTELVKASNVAFDNEAELITFLRTNTGA